MPLATIRTHNELQGLFKYQIVGYQCPRCKNNIGFLFFDKEGVMYFCGEGKCLTDDANASRPTQEVSKASNYEKHDRFNLGSRFANATLSKSLLTPNEQTLIHNWIKAAKGFLIFLGEPECGKTYTCAAIGNFISQKDVVYFNMRMLYQRLQNAIQTDHNQYTVLDEICSKDVVILDDIGSTSNTEWQREMLYELIDQRYNLQAPTVITSSLPMIKLLEIYGDKMTARLKSKENSIILKFREKND